MLQIKQGTSYRKVAFVKKNSYKMRLITTLQFVMLVRLSILNVILGNINFSAAIEDRHR